jgi:Zn-dependent M28 family amino/carboxypeptidase
VNSIFADMNIIRHVTVSSAAELQVVETAILNRFASYGLTTSAVPVTVNRVEKWVHTPGAEPHVGENVPVEGTFQMNNLVAVRPGTDPDLAPIVVTTHWDSMPQTVGMDDNASGCAGALEIARVLQGLTLRRTVIFVLFCFEEDDMGGSAAYAAGITKTPKAVINLEMIGYTSPVQNALPLTDVLLQFPAVGDFIGVVASDFSRNLGLSFCTVADEFVPELPTYYIGADATLQNNPLLTDFLRSDHISFWAQGIPSIMITDTANLRDGTPYHTPYDTVDKIDIPFMINVIKAAAALTCLEAELVP